MSDTERGEGEEISGINVTPLVDVSLVLVLIFMVTSPFFSKPLMNVSLPRAVSSKSENRQNITVSVSPEEGYSVNEIPVDKKALPFLVQSQMDKSGFSFILIRADERVPHGEVLEIMEMAKKIGAKRIAFATMPKEP